MGSERRGVRSVQGAGSGERGARSRRPVPHRSPGVLTASLLLCVLAAAAVLCGVASSAHAAAGDTYTQTGTITPGGSYLLVANISNQPYGATHTPAPTVLGSLLMNSMMAGVDTFTLSSPVLTSTADLASWEFTITSSGTSDGSNPGYYIQRGGSYLDLVQGLTGVYQAIDPPLSLNGGSTTVAWRQFVSQPYTCLSGTPRVWFWNGSVFYTSFTSDTTSIGTKCTDPYWPVYLVAGDASHSGWVMVEWDTPWGSHGGGSEDGAVFTDIDFFLMGMRPGLDPLYPEGLFTPGSPLDQLKHYQYYFGGQVAVAASTMRSAYVSPGSYDLHETSFESKVMSLYQRDVYYSGVTVTARLDGGSYAGYGGTVRLNDGVHNYSVAASGGTATFGSVCGGTYNVYAGGVDTGVDLTVNANNVNANIDFYTLTFGATTAGFATTAQASAVYAGTSTSFTSGAAALKGSSFTITASGSGADTYAYSWSGGVTGTTSSVSITSIAAPTTVNCTVTGYRDVTISKVTDAAVTTQAYVDPGVIDLSTLFTIDPNAGAATYTIEGGSGTGFICDAAGAVDAAGKYLKVTTVGTFTIRVSTAAVGCYNAGTQTNTLTVGHAPVLSGPASTTFVEGRAGSLTVTSTGTAPITISCTGALPTGVTFTDNGDGTATISGTPAAGTRGDYAPLVTATSAFGSSSIRPAIPVNAVPEITSASGTTFVEGVAGTFTVTSTARPTAALSQTGALPTGVTFTDNGDGTATLSGTPAAGARGGYTLTITAANGVTPDATQTFTLSVDAAPAITSADTTTFVEGDTGSFTVTSTGRPDAALSETGALPSGVTFVDNGDGTATLSGTPAAGARGSYELTITAANGVGSDATQTFTLSVNAAPAIGSDAAVKFTEGVAGSFTVTATGRPTPSLSSAGALPSGVTFTDNGDGTATLTGTPAAGSRGSYALAVTATNGVGADAQQTFTLEISSGLPPVTTVAGVPSRWVKRDVGLTFQATAGDGSAAVAYTEYRVGSGEWTRGTAVTIRRQGVTTVAYRSADVNGNVEAAKECTVRIDSVRPVVRDYGHPVCWRGGRARFSFRVNDAATATVKAKLVITRYGHAVRTYSLGRRATGKRLVAGVVCGLPTGTYTWRIVVRDPVGARGAGPARHLQVYPGHRR